MGSLSYLPRLEDIEIKTNLSPEQQEEQDRTILATLMAQSEAAKRRTELDTLFQVFIEQFHKKENLFYFLCEKENQELLKKVGIEKFVVFHEKGLGTDNNKLTLDGNIHELTGETYWYNNRDDENMYDIFFPRNGTQKIHSPQQISHDVCQSMTQIGV